MPKRTMTLHKEVLSSKSLEKSHYLLHSLRISPWTLQKSTVATNNFLAIIPCNLKCKCVSSGGPLIHDQERQLQDANHDSSILQIQNEEIPVPLMGHHCCQESGASSNKTDKNT
jgi:hypothetical protein